MAINYAFVKEQWEKDGKIDKTEPGLASLHIPELHGKYSNFLYEARKAQLEMKQLSKTMLRVKNDYYRGTLSEDELRKYKWQPFPLRLLKEDVERYMEADPDLQKIEKVYHEAQELVSFIDSILKNINQRNFQIKNHIEFLKFINGIA